MTTLGVRGILLIYALGTCFGGGPFIGTNVWAQAIPPAVAPQPLSIEQALFQAVDRSDEVAVARAGVQWARAQQTQARSRLFPQVSGSASYDRTLRTQFEQLALPGVEGELLRELPFGRRNIYQLSLQATQTLFAGGRIRGAIAAAAASHRSADLGVKSARAQSVLDVLIGYYDVVLAERLLHIARAQQAMADDTLAEVRQKFQAGEATQFDVLRAQVTAQNQQPIVLQHQMKGLLAQMRLQQLLDLPADVPVTLVSGLGDDRDDTGPPDLSRLARAAAGLSSDEDDGTRAPVQQAAELVELYQASEQMARAERWPILMANTFYGRVAYPDDLLPGWNQFFTDWTVGVILQMPLFTGLRISGAIAAARADVQQARARWQLLSEISNLEGRRAEQVLKTATTSWAASRGTVEQAYKAYQIAALRFQEGVSTQIELSSARLQLAEAEVNRAQAARDLLVAQVRLALLPALPLEGTAGVELEDPVTPVRTPRQVVPDASLPLGPIDVVGTRPAPGMSRIPGAGGGVGIGGF